MATADVGGIHRTQRSRSHSPGDYNKVTYVGPNSTYFATGSEAGAAGFIIEINRFFPDMLGLYF